MRRSIRILLALGFALGGVACGDKEDASPRSLTEAELQGRWTGACQGSGGTYEQTEWTFAGNSFTYALTAYTDADCTRKDNEIFGRGVYKLGPETNGAEDEVAREVELEYATFTWSFVADPERAATQAEDCGGAARVRGIIDVLGRECAGFSLAFAPLSHGTIRLGDDLVVTHANGRTEALSKAGADRAK